MQSHIILYARKSTEEDDRQILSLDAQEKECRGYAERHGLAITEVVRESHSARRPGRPLFEAMLTRTQALRKDGHTVAILCHKPDRLLRNITDWARLNDQMDQGVELVFVTGSYPNNAQGRMAFGINVVFAKYYVDNLSEEVRKGIKEKLARGGWPCKAPLGYRNVAGRVEVDPVLSPVIRRAFLAYASGEYSLDALCERLSREGLLGREGGRRIARSLLRERILANPFYCGLMRYRGEIYPGSHEPLVSRALYDRVQDRLHGRATPRRVCRDLRYRGVFTCGFCTCAVVGDVKKERYVYYRCSHRRGACPAGYLREEDLSVLLAREVGGRLRLRSWVAEGLLRSAAAARDLDSTEAGSRRQPVEAQLQRIKARLDALLNLRLDGQLGEGEYAEKKAQLLQMQLRLQEEQQSTFELLQGDPEQDIRWFIGICDRLGELMQQASDDEVRALLRIVGSNYRLSGGNVHFEPVEPFAVAARTRSCTGWQAEQSNVRTLLTGVAALKKEHGAFFAGLMG